MSPIKTAVSMADAVTGADAQQSLVPHALFVSVQKTESATCDYLVPVYVPHLLGIILSSVASQNAAIDAAACARRHGVTINTVRIPRMLAPQAAYYCSSRERVWRGGISQHTGKTKDNGAMQHTHTRNRVQHAANKRNTHIHTRTMEH